MNIRETRGRLPWTREELDGLLPRLGEKAAEMERDMPDVRPLPPMTVEECIDLHARLMDAAAVRPLTAAECAMSGQILACLVMAAKAEVLGKRGRCLVIGEDEVNQLIKDLGP